MTDPEAEARRLAEESLRQDDPTGWFERLYAAALNGAAEVPWDRGGPHPLLLEWSRSHGPAVDGRRALVVGSGPGSDAEHIAALGYRTTAFDVSRSAVESARARFPDSVVDYRTADLLQPPAEWLDAFDLVLESMTVQSLPPDYHQAAIARVRAFVAPGGTLMVIAMARDEDEAVTGPPWRLSRSEVEGFVHEPLELVRIEDLRDPGQPGVRRWRVELRRPA